MEPGRYDYHGFTIIAIANPTVVPVQLHTCAFFNLRSCTVCAVILKIKYPKYTQSINLLLLLYVTIIIVIILKHSIDI